MTPDVRTLVDWLGPEGAIAGLEASHLSAVQLMELAERLEVSLDKRMTWEEISNEIVMYNIKRIDISLEEMMAMDYERFLQYFQRRHPSRREMAELMKELGLRPSSDTRRNLFGFVAREIAEMGMYQRIARGRGGAS